jgi:hypothetical protein
MIIKIHSGIHSNTDNNIIIESTYLYKKVTPTGCKPRTFHPTVETIVPNINNNITPDPWL